MKRLSVEFLVGEHPEMGDVAERIAHIAMSSVVSVYASTGVIYDARYTIEDGPPSPSPPENSPPLPD